MFLFFLCERFFVTLNNAKGNACTENEPCSFENCLSKLNKQDLIFISDKLFETNEDIIKLRNFVNSAIKKSANIDFKNALINGSKSSLNFDSFLEISNYDGTISNALFSNFVYPIFTISNGKSMILQNINFKNCYLAKQKNLIILTNTMISFDSVSFNEIIANDSPILLSTSSSLSFHNSSFSYCFASQGRKIPLLLLKNVHLTIIECLFEHNESPVSPFIRQENDGQTSIIKSNFIGNKHTSLIYICDNAKTNIENCSFYDCYGVIYESVEKASLSLSNSSFTLCYSNEKSILYILRSNSNIYDTTFTNCAGYSLIMIIGRNGKTSIYNSHFIDNKPLHSCITSDIDSSSNINNCTFINTLSKESIISSERYSNVLVNSSSFIKSWSPCLLLKTASANIENSVFKESKAEYSRVVQGEKSTLIMSDCHFNDSSQNGLISNTGRNKFKRLHFHSAGDFSVQNSMRLMCDNCTFTNQLNNNNSILKTEYDLKSIIITFICAAVASFFAMFGRTRIYSYMKHCYMKPSYD